MVSESEIDDLLRRVGSQGRVVKVETVSPDEGQLVAGDADGLVTGDMLPGGVAESEASIVVAGAVKGLEGQRCRIQARTHVLVNAAAQHAEISGDDIRVQDDVDHCRLVSQHDIRVEGDLNLAKLVLGDFHTRERRLRHLRGEAEKLAQAQKELEAKRAFKGRRVYRDSANTQVCFRLTLGSVLSVRLKTVAVNLQPLYDTLGKAAHKSRDVAAKEFFSRAVISALLKANKGYIGKNRGRQQVFIKVLEGLRELFDLARQVDALAEQVAAAEGEAEAIMQQLEAPPKLNVEVVGRLGQDTEIAFVLPDVERQNGDVSIQQRTTTMAIRDGEEPDTLDLVIRDLTGETMEQQTSEDELTGVAITCSEGKVSWRRLEAG